VRVDGYAVSHGLLSHRSSGEGRVEERAVLDAQILAIDEAHNFLSSASNRTALVRDSAADNVLLFTATPINREPGPSHLGRPVGADNFDDDALVILDNLYRRAVRQLSDSEKALLRSEIQRFTVRRTKTMLNESWTLNRRPTRTWPVGSTATHVTSPRSIRPESRHRNVELASEFRSEPKDSPALRYSATRSPCRRGWTS